MITDIFRHPTALHAETPGLQHEERLISRLPQGLSTIAAPGEAGALLHESGQQSRLTRFIRRVLHR